MDVRARREAEFFNRPPLYLLHFLERGSSAFNRWLIREILKSWDRQIAFLDPAWIQDKVVLEACCGNPRMLYYFHTLGARRLLGCDVARAFVARGLGCAETYVYDQRVVCGPAPFDILLADAERAPLKAGTVDTVCCFQAMHHVDLERFARECARVVVPGGHVFLSDPVGTHPLRGLGNRVGRAVGPMSEDESAYDPACVAERFRAAGFRVLRLRSLNPVSEIYFQLTELVTRISGTASFYLKLPMALLNRIEPVLENTLLDRYPRLGWRFALALEKS